MLPMHVIVQAAPQKALEYQTVSLRETSWQVIDLSPADLTVPLPHTFEDVLSRLESLDRMFIEPDGSFVWVGGSIESNWQVDGQLHDSSSGLINVEIKGTICVDAWEQLLSCLGWPDVQLLIQLPREGVFMAESEFRRYASL